MEILFPVVVGLVTFFIWITFQTTQLVRENGMLKSLMASQETAIQEATKLRTQLDSVAKGTAELAQQGNANAKLIIEELRKRGITINPGTPGEPPKK